MSISRTLGLALIIGIAAIATGCSNTQATFVNNTSNDVVLEVHGPGLGTGYVAKVPANGRVTTLIQAPFFSLPTIYSWKAGAEKGSFALASDSSRKIWVSIPEGTATSIPAWRHAETDSLKGGALQSGPIIQQP